MSFHTRLLEQTHAARHGLLATPIIQGCLRGEVSLPSYLAFLREAYHHVRHTVPLLQATQGGAARAPRLAARPARRVHRARKHGHDEWILDDIRPAAAMPRPCGTARRDTPPR